MPYIEQRRRDAIWKDVDYGRGGHQIYADEIETAGELNFAITRLVLHYLDSRPANYATYNAIIGVLEDAKLELYRRNIAPYEDEKIVENGDI